MTETMNPFYYLKTAVASFAILASVTYAALSISEYAYADQSVTEAFVDEAASVEFENAYFHPRSRFIV